MTADTEAIRHAFDLYSWARCSLEARTRLGLDLPWPSDLIRPASVPEQPTELDVQALADRLRSLLDPDAEPGDTAWVRLDASANADQLIGAADARARRIADTAAANLPSNEENDQ